MVELDPELVVGGGGNPLQQLSSVIILEASLLTADPSETMFRNLKLLSGALTKSMASWSSSSAPRRDNAVLL